jgi:hypothetical protein
MKFLGARFGVRTAELPDMYFFEVWRFVVWPTLKLMAPLFFETS